MDQSQRSIPAPAAGCCGRETRSTRRGSSGRARSPTRGATAILGTHRFPLITSSAAAVAPCPPMHLLLPCPCVSLLQLLLMRAACGCMTDRQMLPAMHR